MSKSNQCSLEIADHLSRGEYDWCPEAETRLREQHDLIRQQQLEITGLKLEWQVWSDMNLALRDRIAFLESQVYGGSTK